jgi:Protein of unknown function (DUF2530)
VSQDDRDRPPHLPLLSQAAIEPLDVDGVRTIVVGTLVWLAAAAALAPFAGNLRAAGTDWWLWTCLTGAGLGALGIVYCLLRRARLRRAAARFTVVKRIPVDQIRIEVPTDQRSSGQGRSGQGSSGQGSSGQGRSGQGSSGQGSSGQGSSGQRTSGQRSSDPSRSDPSRSGRTGPEQIRSDQRSSGSASS